MSSAALLGARLAAHLKSKHAAGTLYYTPDEAEKAPQRYKVE